jgi:hypothetical protein
MWVHFAAVLLGAGLIASPWLLDGVSMTASIAGVVVGGLLILLSMSRGPVHKNYAGWDRYLAL